jgi:hypothetical protein
MIRQVNGYYCRSCADVELAKRGVDPVDPAASAPVAREVHGPALGEDALGPAGSSLGSRLNVYA